jgi:glycerophosphoryl diester phosphodiesterase
MSFVKYVFLLMVLFSCRKSEEQKKVLVFGHAGMGLSMDNSIYHDNSKEAVLLALNLPTSNGVEVDVRLSKDGTLWLYHDEFLEAESTGFGCVSNLSDVEIDQLNYRTLKKEKLVKLRDVLPLLQLDQQLFIDLKHFNSCQNERINLADLKVALEEQLGNNSANVKLICAYEYWLNELAEMVDVLYTTDDIEEGKALLKKYVQLKGLVMRNATLNSSDVRDVILLNRKIYLYDIRSLKGIKQAFGKCPTGIFADDLRQALFERGYAL